MLFIPTFAVLFLFTIYSLSVDNVAAVTSTTLSPDKDSYIMGNASNTNQGASSILKVQQTKQMRSLVSFDLSPYENNQVSNAKLRIFAKSNGYNWGTGESIEIHKLTTSWTEGNGFNATRGTGAGVTWNCASDSNITNTVANCNPKWSGDSFVSSPTGTTPVTNKTKGVWLEFDVTNDVNSFLNGNPSDNFGWIIKKTNEQSSGSIWFASREATTNQSQLVLTLVPPPTDKINTLDSTGVVGQYTSIDIGTDGFPVISYFDSTNADLKIVHCTSASCDTHDTPTTLDSTGDVGLWTSIAIGTDGFPVISYIDDPNNYLKIVHCTNTACSTHDTPTTLDTGDRYYTSIAIGTDGFPVISYWDGVNGLLKLVHCTSISCDTHDTPTTLDADNFGYFTSIAIGTDGFPVISYFSSTNGGVLKLVHCTNTSCSTHGTPRTLDSKGDVGAFTSIAIGTDGFPVISYQNATNVDLKLVHCTSVSCSTHDTPATLDSIGSVGYYTSIAIGKDGFPVISYQSGANGDLKIVHCTSASCSTHDTPATLDTGNVGAFTSIAIGTDGFPVISYYDNANGDLKTVQRLG